MATWNDLSIQGKRGYLAYAIPKLRDAERFFDRRSSQFDDLKDVLTQTERNKIKADGTAQLDALFAEASVDAYLAWDAEQQ